MTTELEEIIAQDETIGADALQFWPAAYAHRRFLLERLAQYDKDVAELSEVMGIPGNLNAIITKAREFFSTEAAHPEAAVIERELHNPFHTAAAEVPARWICIRGTYHQVGDICNCEHHNV